MNKFILLLAVATTLISGSVATAQPNAAPIEGRSVLSTDGSMLGVVEKVVFNSKGNPAQVLVRPKGKKPAGLHSLAFASLEETASGFAVPLTRAEFDAMPAVDLESAER